MKKKITEILSVLGVFVWIAGCMSAQKAMNKVQNNPELFNELGVNWSKTHPCVNDTTIILDSSKNVHKAGQETIVKGKDSIVYSTDTKNDTVFVNKNIYTPIYRDRVDTVVQTKIAYVVDGRQVQIEKDTAAFYRGKAIEKDGQIAVLTVSLNEQKMLTRSSKIALWSVIGIAIVVIFRGSIWSLIKTLLKFS